MNCMEEKIKAIIVDDEDLARDVLGDLVVEFCPEVELIGMANSVENAKKLISKRTPELIFLDVQMPQADGFELLNSLDKDTQVIFTTAHEEYAVSAFRVEALDYLLKPIDPVELQGAISKVLKNRKVAKSESKLDKLIEAFEPKLSSNLISFPTMEGAVFVESKEIISCSSDGCYTKFKMETGSEVMVSKNLGEIEAKLTPKGFFRVHHSHIVNLAHIRKYIKSTSGGYIEMSDKSHINVSRRKKDQFLDVIS